MWGVGWSGGRCVLCVAKVGGVGGKGGRLGGGVPIVIVHIEGAIADRRG